MGANLGIAEEEKMEDRGAEDDCGRGRAASRQL